MILWIFLFFFFSLYLIWVPTVRAFWPHYSAACPAPGGPQGLVVISIVIVYKVKQFEEIEISWLGEPLEFPEYRYTRHTLLVPAAERRGLRGGDGRGTMVRKPESGLFWRPSFWLLPLIGRIHFLRSILSALFHFRDSSFFTPTRSEGQSCWAEVHSPGSDTLPQSIRSLCICIMYCTHNSGWIIEVEYYGVFNSIASRLSNEQPEELCGGTRIYITVYTMTNPTTTIESFHDILTTRTYSQSLREKIEKQWNDCSCI